MHLREQPAARERKNEICIGNRPHGTAMVREWIVCRMQSRESTNAPPGEQVFAHHAVCHLSYPLIFYNSTEQSMTGPGAD